MNSWFLNFARHATSRWKAWTFIWGGGNNKNSRKWLEKNILNGGCRLSLPGREFKEYSRDKSLHYRRERGLPTGLSADPQTVEKVWKDRYMLVGYFLLRCKRLLYSCVDSWKNQEARCPFWRYEEQTSHNPGCVILRSLRWQWVQVQSAQAAATAQTHVSQPTTWASDWSSPRDPKGLSCAETSISIDTSFMNPITWTMFRIKETCQNRHVITIHVIKERELGFLSKSLRFLIWEAERVFVQTLNDLYKRPLLVAVLTAMTE